QNAGTMPRVCNDCSRAAAPSGSRPLEDLDAGGGASAGLGDRVQALEKLHHRPGVALGVALQRAADVLGLRRIEPPGIQQQALELDAGEASLADLEIVIAQLRHQRSQHGLQAEAAAELRVVHEVPDRKSVV